MRTVIPQTVEKSLALAFLLRFIHIVTGRSRPETFSGGRTVRVPFAQILFISPNTCFSYVGPILAATRERPSQLKKSNTIPPSFPPILQDRMKLTQIDEQKKRLVIFYGSQTGTAEEYAIRIAKEAKSRFGIASLVCDPEEYEFENLDAIPEDCAVIFVMATYGEGEPTDNAVQLMQNIDDSSFEFSKGEHRLDGLKYVVFGLGNRTYEHYNLIARKVDAKLTELGATRLGPRGEGDDDKAMEEDYLEWKEKMWPELAAALNVEEGQGGDTPDFAVTEDTSCPQEKVYLGELSARALTKTRGIHDAKNPFPAPITRARELFAHGHERNCVHVELKIEGSGINYQHGDHVGVWPTNPEVEVDRLLAALGLWDKRNTVINIVSLDPALAKVPFPVPTTYGTVLRHYIDISVVASRQLLGIVSKFAPNEDAQKNLQTLATDKEKYYEVVAEGCLRFGQVLQLVCGNNITAIPSPDNTTAWSIPFETIVSCIPRLQPRYYSISSSPKYAPGSIHITAVVLKYQSKEVGGSPMRWVYGVGSNLLHNLRYAANGHTAPLIAEGPASPELAAVPHYHILGPREAYLEETIYKVPIHVRRSTFRLPTNPRCPVIMIGPGTVSIPADPMSTLPSFLNLPFTGYCPFPRFRPRACISRQARKNGRKRACRLGNDVPILWLPQLEGGLPLQGGMARAPSRPR